MKGRIVNYRGGVNTQRANQIIISPEKSSSREDAAKMLGRKVEWKTPGGKVMVGKISRVHGRKGEVVARFKKGLPGQALGTEIEIRE